MKKFDIRDFGIVPTTIEAIKRLFRGKPKILEWDHDVHQGLMWKFPDPTSPKEIERDIRKVDAFVVKDYERALLLRQGALQCEIPPGTYKLMDEIKTAGTEIIYFSTRQFKVEWGVYDVWTRSNIRVGANGIVVLSIFSPEVFLRKVIGGRGIFVEEDLKEWVKEFVKGSVREVISGYKLYDLLREREGYWLGFSATINRNFEDWGLKADHLEVEGLKLPDEIMGNFERLAMQELIRDYLERWKELEEKRLEIDNYIRTLKEKYEADIIRVRETALLEAQRNIAEARIELEKRMAELTILSEQAKKAREEIEASIKKLNYEVNAGEIETIGMAQARVNEINAKVRSLEEIVRRLAEAEGEARKAEAEAIKIEAETRVKLSKEFFMVLSELLKGKTSIEAIQSIADCMARMAEAASKGGEEGERARNQIRAEFLQLLKGMGIPAAEVLKYLSLKGYPSQFIEITSKETLTDSKVEDTTKPLIVDENISRKIEELENARDKLIIMLSEGKISEEFAKKEIQRLENRIKKFKEKLDEKEES
jgi:hypothetical protein